MKKSEGVAVAVAVLILIGLLLLVLGNADRISAFLGFGGPGAEWTVVEYVPEELRVFTAEEPGDIVFNEALLLINTEHPVSEERGFSVGFYKETDVLMNEAMLFDYARLSAAVTEETDDKLYVMSSYRTFDEQRALYEEDPGIAAEPGTSEHHSGLALDVYVYQYAGAGFADSKAGRFVNAHCHEYGFIIRYPMGKEKITGFPFEPWHIRYVGQPHARYITLNRLTLEEYLERLGVGLFYEFEGWVITRQAGPDFMLPVGASNITVSEDNTGYYVITFLAG